MKTLSDLLFNAKQFMADSFGSACQFPPGFNFSPGGKLAYELVLDASGSMYSGDYPPSRFAAAKQAATAFLQKCVEQTPQALVGVVFYSNSATVASPLLPAQANHRQLRKAIEGGEIDGSTNIPAGLTAAGRQFMAKGAELDPVILLLTDGYSNSCTDPARAASQLKNAGIRLDIVGIGGSPRQVNERELKQMASVWQGQLRYWFIRDTVTLVRKFEALALGKV